MTTQLHPLTSLRTAMGLSHPAYARLVAKTHAVLGYGQMAARREKISRWESGRIVPELTAQLAMGHVHRVPDEAIRRLGWPHWLNAAAGSPAQFDWPWTPQHAVGSLRIAESASSAEKHARPEIESEPLTAEFVAGFENALVSEHETENRMPGARVSDQDMLWMESRVEGIEEGSLRIAPHYFLPGAQVELRMITSHLSSSRYDHATGSRLFHLAGRTADICGNLSILLGNPVAAERYFLSAVRSQAVGAKPHWAPASMSGLAYTHLQFGQPEEALRLIRAAQSGAGLPSVRLRRLLSTREALIHASLGDRQAAIRALDDATGTLFAGPEEEGDDPELDIWLRDTDEEWLTIRAGMTMLRLGDHRTAIDHFSALLDEGASTPRRTHPALAWELLEAAEALLATGEPEAAAHPVRRAMRLHRELPPAYLQRVRRQFTKHQTVREVKDLIWLIDQASSA